MINKNVYHISCVPFEDKSEQDKDGNYEYYYKGRNISFCRDKEWVEGRMYDEEEVISFFQNPILAFGGDFEAIKMYLGKEYGIRRFRFLDRESKVSVYTLRKYKFLAGRQFDVVRNFRNKV